MRFVILHGTSRTHASNWFPWLKTQLEARGHEVWVPDLPDADHPDIARYNAFLRASGYDFDNAVIIGHSAGSVAINGLLQALPEETTINTAILVGTFRGDLGWDALHGVDVPFDYEKIRSKAKQFIVIHSDNDPHCPIEGAKWIAEKLGAQFILMPGKQHFSKRLDPSFDSFPELLTIIDGKVL